ncbi:MAG: aminotransferase class IV [Phycisphaeraceae bacterium]|nr:aminotransferase class IV [Phycisphaeraceae bacterium]
MQVWLNGEFIERDDARLSIFDAGVQHGVGLFETMSARNGRVFRLHHHLDRLRDSARELGLTERLNRGPLAEAVQRTLERSGLREARLRLTVTGGDLNLLQSRGETRHEPTVFIVAQPPTRYPQTFFRDGVIARVADARLNPLDPFSGHKTLWYWPRLRELQFAARAGAGESLWFSVTNHLMCGSVSNVFLVWNDQLLTPIAAGEEESGSLRAPVLPGITRRAIMESAEDLGIDVVRRMLTWDDIEAADEMFLTNSSWGVLPVVRVEQHAIGGAATLSSSTSDDEGSAATASGPVPGAGEPQARPGPLTLVLRERWLALVEAETSSESAGSPVAGWADDQDDEDDDADDGDGER